MSVARWTAAAIVASLCVGCTASSSSPASPTPAPTISDPSMGDAPHPGSYFNLSEEDALDYIGDLIDRSQEAIRAGDLGVLKDVYTLDGPAGRAAEATIVRDFRNRWINATEVELVRTRILSIDSQLAVFEIVRLVRPCVYDFNTNLDMTEDGRERREVVKVFMADEYLNWRLDREVVMRSAPTGEPAPCPPR